MSSFIQFSILFSTAWTSIIIPFTCFSVIFIWSFQLNLCTGRFFSIPTRCSWCKRFDCAGLLLPTKVMFHGKPNLFQSFGRPSTTSIGSHIASSLDTDQMSCSYGLSSQLNCYKFEARCTHVNRYYVESTELPLLTNLVLYFLHTHMLTENAAFVFEDDKAWRNMGLKGLL